MAVDLAWFEAQVEAYKEEREKHYQPYAEVLEKVLRAAVCRLAPLGIVQARAKTVASFAEKILRREKAYTDPLHQLTDLCGARVIVHTREDVERVGRFIRDHFEIDEANSLDAAERLAADKFGYRSVHYVVQFKPGVFPSEQVPVAMDDELLGLKAEIQVRTIVQHAWADIGHDRLYKPAFQIPDPWKREAARVAAMLESADESFSRLVAMVDTYRLHYSAYLNAGQMQEEMERLEAVLRFAPEEERLAQRICRLAIALEQWQRAIDCVERFRGERSAALWTALGFATCQLHRDHRHGPDYAAGRSYLEEALKRHRGHLEAHLHLAETWDGIDERKALEHSERAFALDAAYPRSLAGYIIRKVAFERSPSVLPLLRPKMEEAILRCSEQAKLGVDLPWAYYWKALFELLLDQPYAALEDCARAVCLSTGGFMIDAALRAVDVLSVVEQAVPRLDWLRKFLLLGRAARFPSPDVQERLARMATQPNHVFQEPVVIVAGGCDPAYEEQMQSYRELLAAALSDFRGTIVSGGTTAGVSGLVGELTQAAGDRIRAIGYIPKHLPADGPADRRYHELRETSGTGFTALEPLQNWIDLLASGVAPERVRVLGINGGTIASFEYRMASALGAKVGVLRDSGRGAGKLAQDTQWESIPGLALLPADPLTLQTFIALPTRSLLTPEQREQLGRAFHEQYRKDHQERFSRQEPVMNDWENLPDPFRQSCLQLADHIAVELASIGLRVVPVTDREIRLYQFSPEQVERLAEREHARWNVERLLDGWTLGPRDPDKKQSPYLVGWDELPEEAKEWDRQIVRRIPEFLAGIGMEIQPA